MNLINETLQQYIDLLDAGFGLISGDVRWLLNALVIINIALSAAMWALSDDQIVVQLARKALHIGIFAWIVDNWPKLTSVVAETFIYLGLKAGGAQASPDVMLNPGSVAGRGVSAVGPIMQAMRDLSGPIAFFENFAEIFLLALAILAILIAFFVIAIQIVVALLTFKLGTLGAFILVPFGLLQRTSFVAERPLGWVVASGVRLMLLTLVVGIGESLFQGLQLTSDTMSVHQALNVALGAIVLMVLAMLATRIASEMAMGTPRVGPLDAALAVGATGASMGLALRETHRIGGRIATGGVNATRAAAMALNRGGSSNSRTSGSRQQ